MSNLLFHPEWKKFFEELAESGDHGGGNTVIWVTPDSVFFETLISLHFFNFSKKLYISPLYLSRQRFHFKILENSNANSWGVVNIWLQLLQFYGFLKLKTSLRSIW